MKRISNSQEQLQHIITNIYDSALEKSHWEKVIEILTQALQAEQGYMRIIDKDTNNVQLTYSYNKDHSWIQAFKDHYVHLDPWLNEKLCKKNTTLACTHHYIPNCEYEAMEYYQDFVRPQKIHYGIGGLINVGKNITAYFAHNRSKEKQGFQNEHLENLQFLAPHLQKALLINQKTHDIELEKNLLTDALNQINSPVLLVNKNGKVLFINTQAEKIIENQTGLIILNGHLIIRSSEENKNLQRLIINAAQQNSVHTLQQGGAMNYTVPTTQTSLSILVTPINANKANIDIKSDEVALLLLNTNNQQPTLSIELINTLYSLTKAEARLTMLLCKGMTLNEISENLCLSKNTLKTQLRSCFNKIGVYRQADLVRVVSANTTNFRSTSIS